MLTVPHSHRSVHADSTAAAWLHSLLAACDRLASPHSHPSVPADSTAAAARLYSLLAACDRLASRPEPDSGPTVRRLAVRSLGSPLWSASPELVLRACHLLRALVRCTGAVAMVTVPTHLWPVSDSVCGRGGGDMIVWCM